MIYRDVQNLGGYSNIGNSPFNAGKTVNSYLTGYVQTVPTIILFAGDKDRYFMVLQIANNQIIQITGWLNSPFYRPGYSFYKIFTREKVLFIPDQLSQMAIMEFAIDPLTGLIANPAYLKYTIPECASGGGTIQTGFLAPFVDDLGYIVVKNTYAGTTFGGDDIAVMNTGFIHNTNNDFGVNAFYNSVSGQNPPYSHKIDSLNLSYQNQIPGNNNIALYLGYGYMMGLHYGPVYLGRYMDLVRFSQDYNGAGSNIVCNLNTVTIKGYVTDTLDAVPMSDNTPNYGAITTSNPYYSSPTCPRFGTFVGGGSKNANHVGTYGVIYAGNVISKIVDRAYFYNDGFTNVRFEYRTYFLDTNNYVYVFTPFYPDNQHFYVFRTNSTMQLSAVPAKIVKPINPVPVYGTDCNRYFG